MPKMSSCLRSFGHFCKTKYLYSKNANHVRKRASSNCPRYWWIWFDHCKPIPAVLIFQVVSSIYSSRGFSFQRMPRSDLMKVFKSCRFRGFLHVFSSFCQCYPARSTTFKGCFTFICLGSFTDWVSFHRTILLTTFSRRGGMGWVHTGVRSWAYDWQLGDAPRQLGWLRWRHALLNPPRETTWREIRNENKLLHLQWN